MDTLQSSPVNASQIETWTNNDPVLARVQNMIQKNMILMLSLSFARELAAIKINEILSALIVLLNT